MDDAIFNLEYPDSIPPLTKAVRGGNLSQIKKLLAKGYQPQTPDNRGWTPIHCCVAENQLKALQLILKLQPKNKKYLLNLTTWENVTPLHIALKCSKPCVKMVKTLLEGGADPNGYTHMNISPLHLACMKKGNYQLVKLLVEFGADVNVQELLGLLTPLHIAVCESCDSKIIKYLLHLNVINLDLKNNNNRTAFLEACNSNFTKAVELFLTKDKNLANIHYGIPPLAYAGFVGNLEMTRLLLNSNANPNVKCKAMVSYNDYNSDLILLDRECFLPIHSSLTNIEVFELLLSITNTDELLQLETNYYSFPIFVVVNGGEAFFKKLLQSDFPNSLKIIKSKVLVKFYLSYPDMRDFVLERIPVIFKYNFDLEPESVLESLTEQISSFDYDKYKFVSLLVQMGISSQFQSKNKLLGILDNFVGNCSESSVVSSTFGLLSKTVLSLKQYCRIVVRRQVKRLVGDDLLALKVVESLEVPDCLKKFLLFESFT